MAWLISVTVEAKTLALSVRDHPEAAGHVLEICKCRSNNHGRYSE